MLEIVNSFLDFGRMRPWYGRYGFWWILAKM